MKHTIKSILKVVLTFGLVLGFFLCSGESEDMGIQMAWTFGWLAEMVLCAWGLNKLFPEIFNR